ncbi:hypothetical protein ACNVED_05885 [Legionella sp. D16C41]|uniref:hypothetical protein n=1 Tax=Legionella sp. D16C41 TaxID=3402688 RepID=UPI003AF9E011
MTYRTEKAQAAHEAIIRYIKGVLNKEVVTAKINRLDFATLTETSINGHSHLLDAIHLSLVLAEKDVDEKINFLIKIILKKAQELGKDALLFLLKTPCHRGFTPLNSLLKDGSLKNFKAFFAVIHDFIQAKYLTPQDYKDLLFFVNKYDKSILNTFLHSEKQENFKAYFNEIHNSIDNGILDVKDYINFILSAEAPHSTILHYANLINSANFNLLFEEFNYLITQHYLPTNQFYDFISKIDSNNLTLLQHIITNNNLTILQLFLKELKKSVQNQWISSADLSKLLLTTSVRGFSVIHLAIFDGSLELLQELFNFLNECLNEDLLPKKTLQTLILIRNQTGLTAFASAIKTGKAELIAPFINFIQQATKVHWLTANDYCKLFVQASNRGTTPLYLALFSQNIEFIKEYFLGLKEGLAQGYLKEKDIKLLFMKRTCDGDTCLAYVVKNGFLSLVKFFLQEVKELCSNSYLTILNQKIKGELVVCIGKNEDAKKINSLLNEERTGSLLNQSSPLAFSNRFFKPSVAKVINKAINTFNFPGNRGSMT